nr:unnamed protein product [Callosobruchus analis]
MTSIYATGLVRKRPGRTEEYFSTSRC